MPTDYASGSNQQTLVGLESAWGTIATQFAIVPTSQNSLAAARNILDDDTLRPDRQTVSIRTGLKTVAGELPVKFRYADYDELLAGALMGSWQTNVLKMGTTESSFSIEKGFTDIGQYLVYLGCKVSGISLSVQPDSLILLTFKYIGKTAVPPATASADLTPTASSTNPPFDSFTGSILEGGVATGAITSLELNIDNQMEGKPVLFSKTVGRITHKRVKVSGTLNTLFTSVAMLNKFLNETASSISFTLTDLLGNAYTFLLPALKYTAGDPPITTEGEIIQALSFSAYYDGTQATTLKVTRTPHAQ